MKGEPYFSFFEVSKLRVKFFSHVDQGENDQAHLLFQQSDNEIVRGG